MRVTRAFGVLDDTTSSSIKFTEFITGTCGIKMGMPVSRSSDPDHFCRRISLAAGWPDRRIWEFSGRAILQFLIDPNRNRCWDLWWNCRQPWRDCGTACWLVDHVPWKHGLKNSASHSSIRGWPTQPVHSFQYCCPVIFLGGLRQRFCDERA